MGLNVPVEITKANYLAKKKAGTLNANTYYNVIDEYDSANVINDSSVTANSAFSSTKSEKTYAKKSTLVNTTLTASKWTGSSAPYSYVLSVSGVTSSNIVEIDYASNASSAAIEAYQNAMLADGGQTTNQITIKATEKPTVDIPITTLMSYNKRGAELQRKYAALANEMAKEYIPEYLEGHQYSWIIPNNSDEMTITIKCNCEIPELEGIA